MPIFKILTNVPHSKVPADFLTQATDVVAKVTGKEKQYVTAAILPGQLVLFGGTNEPCAIIELLDIGPLDNKTISAAVFKLIQEKLGIPNTRAYVSIIDKEASQLGFMSTTVEEVLKKLQGEKQ